MRSNPLPSVRSGRHFVIGFGKTACTMVEAVLAQLPKRSSVSVMVVTNFENVRDLDASIVLGFGHPIPVENGSREGRTVLHLQLSACNVDHELCLIFCGRSFLLPAPLPGITLADNRTS
ncbi:MAG: DUF4147 domain-containing protein [Ruegeria sp.]